MFLKIPILRIQWWTLYKCVSFEMFRSWQWNLIRDRFDRNTNDCTNVISRIDGPKAVSCGASIPTQFPPSSLWLSCQIWIERADMLVTFDCRWSMIYPACHIKVSKFQRTLQEVKKPNFQWMNSWLRGTSELSFHIILVLSIEKWEYNFFKSVSTCVQYGNQTK